MCGHVKRRQKVDDAPVDRGVWESKLDFHFHDRGIGVSRLAWNQGERPILWDLEDGSLVRSKWWRRDVVEVALVVAVTEEEEAERLRASSSSSLSSILTSIFDGFLLSISATQNVSLSHSQSRTQLPQHVEPKPIFDFGLRPL